MSTHRSRFFFGYVGRRRPTSGLNHQKSSRRQPPCSLESLEDRRLLTASTLTIGQLQFVALGGFSQSASTYSATGTVAVGFNPGSDTFKPVLQLKGDVTVKDDASPSFSIDGKVSEVLTKTPIDLFNGSYSFDIDSLLNDGLSGLDGLSFDVAGVGFDLGRILLVNGANNSPEIQLQGSLSVAGLTVAVNGTNSVDIDESGVTLTGVDATLNGSVTLGSVTFSADDLSIAYANTQGNDIFTVMGSTSFTVSSSTVEVDWGGTTPKGTSTAGLIVENGSIKSLDMAVTGSVTVAALGFTADDLIVTYTEASSTFAMTGKASFQLAQDNSIQNARNEVSVDFGGTAGDHTTSGLVVVNGVLTTLDMTVDASFELFSLSLDSKGLVIEYQNDPSKSLEQFVMYGDLALTSSAQAFGSGDGRVFDKVNATLGDEASPGLVLKDGVVEDVNVTINGQLNLFSLHVTPDDLHVTYSRSDSKVEITGELKVKLAGDFKATTKLDHGGILIDSETGKVKIDGVTLDLSDVPLGAVTIQHFDLSFKEEPSGPSIDASLVLTFSGGWSVDAAMDFADGEVNQITVGYSAGPSQGIELGPSGLFLTYFSTTIENIAQGVVTVTGSITVDYGPHVTINGQSVAIISASGDFLVNSSELTLTDIDVSIADNIIGTGKGSLVANWAAGDYSLTASLSLFDGIFDVNGSVQFNSQGDFLLVADASVEVPEAVPVFGGDTVASMNFAFKYLNNAGNPTGFIAAWDTISFLDISQSIGFEYEIDGSISSGSFNLIGDDGVAAVESQLNLTPAYPNNEYGPQYVFGYFKNGNPDLVAGPVLNVPEGATTVSLLLQSESGNFPGYIFLLIPPSTAQSINRIFSLAPTLNPISSPQYFYFPETNASLTFSVRQDSSTTIAVLIQTSNGQTLPAGQYAILYLPSWTGSPPTAVNSLSYLQPQVEAPTIQEETTPNTATLSASGLIAASLAETTVVSFFATTSPTAHQGVFLGDVSVSQGGLTVGTDGAFTATLNWDASSFPSGSYFIYALVKDGQNPPVLSSNSTSSITLHPMVKGLVTAANQPVAGATVQLFYNADPNNLPSTPDQVAVTGPDGKYAFRSDQAASPGSPLNFVVNLVLPAGFEIHTPTAYSGSYTGEQPVSINYYLVSKAVIRGTVTETPIGQSQRPILGATVFLDLNRNGQLDPAEPSTQTDSQGNYTFLNVAPGSYRVAIQTPDGHGASTPTAQEVTVADEYQGASGINFGVFHLDTTPASSIPVYPAGGKTVGPIVTTSISGTAFDPRGASSINAVLVSVQDLTSGLYWNGYHFVASETPILLTAKGTVSWRLPLAVSTLISGHTYQIGSRAIDAEGYSQASPSFQTFTYKGPATATPPTSTPTISVASSQPISVTGQPVEFTVTVSGAGVPTGSVWLADGSVMLSIQPLLNGQATFQIGSLSLGPHTIQAYYTGDAIFLPGASSAITQTVERIKLDSASSAASQEGTSLGSHVLNIGGALTGSGEQIILRSIRMGRFVQVRIVQAGTSEILYQGGFQARSLGGIIIYDGPGEETVRTIGRVPFPVWLWQSGGLSPLSAATRTGQSPFRNRLPRFSAGSIVSNRLGHFASTADRWSQAGIGPRTNR